MKLVEADIENVVVQKLRNALHDMADNISVVGVWQTDDDGLKGEEDNQTAVIGVKAFPRSYETPTIPDAQIQVQVSLATRADKDFSGRDYLWITSVLSSVFQRWQNDFAALSDFNLEDEFNVTGFALDGGDCGIDRDNCVWQYSQAFTIYGIVLDSTTTDNND